VAVETALPSTKTTVNYATVDPKEAIRRRRLQPNKPHPNNLDQKVIEGASINFPHLCSGQASRRK